MRMKKSLSLLLICSAFFIQCSFAFAGNIDNKDKSLMPQSSGLVPVSEAGIMKNEKKSKDKESTGFVECDDSDSEYIPTKWEVAKNIFTYLGMKFLADVKSYVTFYPLLKISQALVLCAWFFPTYALYKGTGIDIPYEISTFFAKNENLSIIGANLYNLLPMILSSFLFKWGRDFYDYCKYMKYSQ